MLIYIPRLVKSCCFFMIANTPPKLSLLGGGGLPGAPPPLYEAMVHNWHAHLDKMAEVVATEKEQFSISPWCDFSFSPWCDLLQESLFQALESCVCKVYLKIPHFLEYKSHFLCRICRDVYRGGAPWIPPPSLSKVFPPEASFP